MSEDIAAFIEEVRLAPAHIAGIDPADIERAAPEAAARFAARHDGGRYPGYWKDLIEQVKTNNATSPSWTVSDLRRIGCPTLLVNDAGHAVHYEQPALVGGRIADFLRRHS